jgi:hypothetical protein
MLNLHGYKPGGGMVSKVEKCFNKKAILGNAEKGGLTKLLTRIL